MYIVITLSKSSCSSTTSLSLSSIEPFFWSHQTQFFRVYHLYFCFRTISWSTNHTHTSNAIQGNKFHFQNTGRFCFLCLLVHNCDTQSIIKLILFFIKTICLIFTHHLHSRKAEPKKNDWIWLDLFVYHSKWLHQVIFGHMKSVSS